MGEIETFAAPDGRRARRAVAGAFEINQLFFPPSYRQEPFSPERGYVVVPLEGSVCKTFLGDSATLTIGTVSTLPAGAAHSSDFAPGGAQVLVIRAASADDAALGALVMRRRHERMAASTHLARRIAAELVAGDAGTLLALEGLVLQLLATTSREVLEQPRRSAAWLATIREILDAEAPARLSLTDLAARVGRHPAQVARAFRREFGVSVARYARAARLEWAREQLATSDVAINQIAVAAGYVDQSHFTRAFHLHAGITPARYREQARG
jgi:AraC family transcriptional regulator